MNDQSGKIVHLIGQLVRGGTERQLLYVTQALKARGWQQTIITFSPGAVWDNQVAATLKSIPRHPLPFWRLFQLFRHIQQEQPAAIIHSWSAHTNVYLAWLPLNIKRIASLRLIPNVNRVTGESSHIPHAYLYRRMDAVISNSQAALDTAKANGALFRHSAVVGNITPAPGQATPDDLTQPTRLIAVGALLPRKGYDDLLRALAVLQGEDFELQIAGDGPERQSLQNLAIELGLRVHFLGGREDITDLLAEAHLFIHPAKSEGLSNAILEAMGQGLPVIAAATGGTPELIQDGVNGLLVPPDNPTLLAKKIRQLLNNPAQRRELGQAALTTVQSRYNAEIVTAQYEAVYHHMLKNP